LNIKSIRFVGNILPTNKKAQLSLTNLRDAKARQKLLQFDVLTTLSLKIQTYSVQGHPRSSILVSIESAYAIYY